jgi:hypothetical protein
MKFLLVIGLLILSLGDWCSCPSSFFVTRVLAVPMMANCDFYPSELGAEKLANCMMPVNMLGVSIRNSLRCQHGIGALHSGTH